MTSPLFTTIGEILVDFTPLLEGGQTVGFRMHPGGSPFNVAVGLARLGARVEFAAKVSTDFFGRFLLAHLEREGIGRRLLSRSDAPTTLAFVALEGGEPAFSFYQDGTADTLLRPEDLPADIAACQVLHFGSISLLRDPTASTVAGLVERLRGGPLLSFDPNIRPNQVADAPAFRRLIDRLLQAADLVKVSAADLRWLAPARSVENAAAGILQGGPAMVVVTLGRTAAMRSRAVSPYVWPHPGSMWSTRWVPVMPSRQGCSAVWQSAPSFPEKAWMRLPRR